MILTHRLEASPRTFTSEGMTIEVNPVFKTNGILWGLAFISPREILVTEKLGRLIRLDLETQQSREIKGLPALHPQGQGGLLDVAVHPDFSKNRLIYLTYSFQNGKDSWTTRLSRARLDDGQLTNSQILFTADIDSDEGVHFGSRIVFGRDGKIYFGVGDRGQRDRAQELSAHNGKIFRLNDDGSVPKENPFLNNPKARPEIWSYGHRNPQGMGVHPVTGELWSNEHGPRGGDEINRIQRGLNYGWPIVTYGREYWGPRIGEGATKPGIEAPVHQFTPSIAPSSLVIYSGKMFPAWKGDFFSGALVLEHLNRVVLKPDGTFVKEERLLRDLKERFRNVVEGPNGSLLVSTDSGRIYELKRSGPNKKP